MKWTRHKLAYGTAEGHSVFKVGAKSDVRDPTGRFWAAVRRDGTLVQASDMQLPYEGVHRFATLRDAQWHLEVHDQD